MVDQPVPPPDASAPVEQTSPAQKTPEVDKNLVVELNKNIKIFPGQPLPQYDRGPIKAYKGQGEDKAPRNLIVFLCELSPVPRWNAAGNYVMVNNPNIATLVATGSVYWPPAKCEKFVMVYEQNWGNLLLPKKDKSAYGIKQDLIMDQFLPTMVGILKDFQDKGFVHGGIRRDNFFNNDSNQLKNFILGEGLSTPASYLQPILYEPIERAMTDPIARGMGHFVDDIYSFGVLLTVMIRVNDPMEGLTGREIIEEKIEKGSYAALTGKDRFTGAILELLRGVLHDDKSQRWTIENVISWMEGQRLSPKQALKRKKSSRVFHMDQNRYSRAELIAYDINNHPGLVMQFIEDQKLEIWIERSLEDELMLERYETAISAGSSYSATDSQKYSLASRLSIALDPSAPLRYKNVVVHPDGIGAALAEAFTEQKDLGILADIIDQGLVMFWLNSQHDRTLDYGALSTRFESCRSYLKNKGLGFGLERCLYFLNPETPCLSAKLKYYFVKSPEEMVNAFEDMAEKNKLDGLPLDRHSIAFLSVKDSRILDTYLIELNAQEPYKNILGNTWAIATIQKRYNMPPLPHLAKKLIGHMKPVLERFHDRHLRANLKKEFDKITQSGDLSKLISMLENIEIIEKDNALFQKAMRHYQSIDKEKRAVEKKLEKKGQLGKSSGRMAAAIIAVALGGIAIITLALVELSGKGTF